MTIHLNRSDVLPVFHQFSKCKTFQVEVTTEVRFSDNAWSDGTRYSYRGVNLETGEIHMPKCDEYGNPFTHPGVPTVSLEKNSAIIKFGVFCGKIMPPTIFLHPDNAAKLIKNEKDIISADERVVLVYTRSLKNSYGGEKNVRFKEANRDIGITQERWDLAKSHLIELKMLNKAGAITIDGRNCVGNTQAHELKRLNNV